MQIHHILKLIVAKASNARAMLSASANSTEYLIAGTIFILIIPTVLALLLLWKEGKLHLPSLKLPSLKKEEVREGEGEGVETKLPTRESESEKEKFIEKQMELLKERAKQEQERAKKIEEKYDELRVEYEKAKEIAKRKEEEAKKAQELAKKMEEESEKLVRIISKRYKKGHYIPAVLWTKRGNALPYKFVVEMGWVNGGWRALLVDSITADPETGEWFPSLDKPAPNFLFRDDPGFEPDNPQHSVLFDVNRHEFEEDLKISQADPESKPVALIFGVDLEGNPVHRLQYGAGIHINTLRAENRKLKVELMKYMHMLRETQARLSDAEYKYQMEKDLREHLEKEMRLLKAQVYELKDAAVLASDELEAAREAFRTQRLRRIAAERRAQEAEKMFDAYYGRPQVYETSIQPYLEQKSKEIDAKIVAMLAPIARREASMYGIEKKGRSDEEIVDDWIKKKVEQEGTKAWIEIAKSLGFDMVISDMIRSNIV